MKAWLNNPYVVIALVLCAGYFVYQQVAPAFDNGTTMPVDMALVAPRDGQTQSPANQRLSARAPTRRALANGRGSAADLAAASALGTATRDPFHPSAQVRKTPPLKAQTAQPGRTRALPQLSAIVDSPSSKYAVLDAEIVGEGSVVGEFTVTQISGYSVSLSGPTGQRVLTLASQALKGAEND